jgi:hypothetical protein
MNTLRKLFTLGVLSAATFINEATVSAFACVESCTEYCACWADDECGQPAGYCFDTYYEVCMTEHCS